MTRPPGAPSPARHAVPLGALVLLGLLIVILTHADYGPSWDAAVQARYGELALDYFRSLGADRAVDDYLDLRFYGPLVEMVPALFQEGGGASIYRSRHLVVGLIGLLAIPAAWRLGTYFGPRSMPLLTVLGVMTLPRFYGHLVNNSKDGPFAVFVLCYVASLAALIRHREPDWWRFLVAALALGLALCVRAGGFPILALLWLAAFLLSSRPGGGRTAWRRAAPRWLAVPAIGWVLMILPWPWAHRAPIAHPIEAMRVAAEFATTMPVLFAGETYSSDALPWYYVPGYVLVTTPILVLTLAALGLALGARSARRWPARTETRLWLLILLWLVVPLALAALLRPNVYGGMRHFVFVLPALGVLAAYGAASLIERLEAPHIRRVASLFAALLLALPTVSLVRLHPYQATFYNSLVGGVAGASDRFWTDYSLSSYAEALEWVNGRSLERGGTEIRVLAAAPPPVMSWLEAYADERVTLRSLRELDPEERRSSSTADYYIASTRLDADEVWPDAEVVHTVGRAGAVFTVIKKGGD